MQVIFYEQDWNPQADKQALQRAHRIGQKSPVLAINLITPNTIEEVSTVKGMILLSQHGFWLGVDCFAYNTFQSGNFSAGLEVHRVEV